MKRDALRGEWEIIWSDSILIPGPGWFHWKDFAKDLVEKKDKAITIGTEIIRSDTGKTWVLKDQIVHVDSMEVKFEAES